MLVADAGGPSYISAHSADVILSDIRPIKLKVEALRSINVLLDEFLYSILNTACSLSTDKLRASLLSLLPTTLGKEALLEAEVELRAYWDRTGPADARVLEDDAKTFQLQWAFELLRLKCEAYSTLNETDEDPGSERRINDRILSGGGVPTKTTLVAPAALYLTAILEAMCEHILSNVGRVASRDGSRTTATANDLFVALCEDHAIYHFFKTMKVYEQIEELSKGPHSRRSKSFSRSDKYLGSSTHQDLSNSKDGPPQRSRLSSESGMTTTAGSTPASVQGSRSSIALKMFMANSRTSTDRDIDPSQVSHKKSDSEIARQSSGSLVQDSTAIEDEAMQQEFDDLMRSSATVKVSLTPDRLKTMEAYKQEKDQRSNRPVLLTSNSPSDISIVPPRGSPRRLPDSIKEDDEESTVKPSRTRQASVSNPPKSFASSSSRVRAVSTSGVTPRVLMKFSRTTTPPVAIASGASAPVKTQDHNHPMAKGQGHDQFPPRTRAVQRNLESIDLDEIMGESEDENVVPSPPQVKRMDVVSSPGHPRQTAVSASTRELMDFLAQGPPDTTAGDTSGSIPAGFPGGEPGKSKGSRRLQKMISKLSLGGGRGSHDDLSRTSKTSQSSSRLQLDTTSSMTNLSSLANRPIPPRPPPPISPHSTSLDSFEEQSYLGARSRSASLGQKQQDQPEVHRNSSVTPPHVPSHKSRDQPSPSWRPPITTGVNGHSKSVVLEKAPTHITSPSSISVTNGSPSSVDASQNQTPKLSSASPTNPISPKRIQPRKPAPVYNAAPTDPHMCYDDIRDMHRLLSRATSADECRLIFDMVLAKSGIKIEPTDRDGSIPLLATPPSATTVQITPADTPLEHYLVELLLGGADYASESEMHMQQTSHESKDQVVSTLPSSHGDKQIADENSSVTSVVHDSKR